MRHLVFLLFITLCRTLESTTLIQDTKSLILISDEKQLLGTNFYKKEGIQTYDVQIPGNFEDFQARMYPYFYDKDLTEDDIQKIKNAITNYFAENERPFIFAYVPEQEISQNSLVIVVKESKLDDISVINNKWTGKHTILQHIKLKKKDLINKKTLRSNLNYLNSSPFRRVDAIYAEGAQDASTNLELLVYDRFPLRPYAGVDNTGLKVLRRNRNFFGFNWNNILNLDQTLSYQFTFADNTRNFLAHTLEYVYYLPWNNTFKLFGGYSTIHRLHTAPTLTYNRSHSSQASMRYDIPLPIFKYYNHDIIAGFDFKRVHMFVNHIELSGHHTHIVNLTQLLFEYTGNYQRKIFRTALDFQLYYSPGQIFSRQLNANFFSIRQYATNEYIFGRLIISSMWELKRGFTLVMVNTGQLANANLLQSEELGIGGYNSVRGYYDREVNVDSGYILNLELHFPAYVLVKSSNINSAKNGIRALIFIDYGKGFVHKAQKKEPKEQYLISFGPGARLYINPYVIARFDWGFKGHYKRTEYGKAKSMVHFSVTASY